MRVRHRDFDIEGCDNMELLPDERAVFGLFAMIRDEPVNCRYIGQTQDLQRAVRSLYESPETEGLRRFMQGPWVKLLQYTIMTGSSEEMRQAEVREWVSRHRPAITGTGEYPGYSI
jgi:hypothetical protein